MSMPQRCIGPLPLNPLDLLNEDRKSRSKTGDAEICGMNVDFPNQLAVYYSCGDF